MDRRQLASMNAGKPLVESTTMSSVILKVPRREGAIQMHCSFSTSNGKQRELDISCNLDLKSFVCWKHNLENIISPVSTNSQLLLILQRMRTAVILLLVSLVIADGRGYSPA